jgi:hypothetical protein
VEIIMPRKLVEDTFNGYMTKMREQMGIGKTEGQQTAPTEPADNAQVEPAAPAAPAAGGAPSVPAV